ncbi:uncharacterized protein EV154DRAFT_560090 [Mucor mucedo]|uniref:uncharacterized protein n=1 Tax=Mucor mucedo TaxID=29922 RepID=UPI002220BBF2|nr:uncharacterized protein EV154DRAFT_560090 [Mucor mucedo]KAI7894721.1 hypothetical protein EV154DRAFT_560090 [Mucor mucedo]
MEYIKYQMEELIETMSNYCIMKAVSTSAEVIDDSICYYDKRVMEERLMDCGSDVAFECNKSMVYKIPFPENVSIFDMIIFMISSKGLSKQFMETTRMQIYVGNRSDTGYINTIESKYHMGDRGGRAYMNDMNTIPISRVLDVLPQLSIDLDDLCDNMQVLLDIDPTCNIYEDSEDRTELLDKYVSYDTSAEIYPSYLFGDKSDTSIPKSSTSSHKDPVGVGLTDEEIGNFDKSEEMSVKEMVTQIFLKVNSTAHKVDAMANKMVLMGRKIDRLYTLVGSRDKVARPSFESSTQGNDHYRSHDNLQNNVNLGYDAQNYDDEGDQSNDFGLIPNENLLNHNTYDIKSNTQNFNSSISTNTRSIAPNIDKINMSYVVT